MPDAIIAPDLCEVVDAASGAIRLADQTALTQLTAVRVLPQRRWVFRAQWSGKAVFAKVFVGAQAAKYAARDAQGVGWLTQAGLATPALLWQGESADQRARVLIYAAIAPADNADVLYQSLPSAQGLALLKQLVQTLAAQHAAGLIQTDLHLKNFLLADGQVWSLDGDGIQQARLSKRRAYRQLAELLSKIQVLDQHAWVAPLLAAYDAARGWQATLVPATLLAWAKQMKAQEVERYVTRKIFRTCSDVTWQQTSQSAQAVSTTGGLHVTDLPALEVAMHVGQVLKPGNTCTVVHTHLQDQSVVIKRYNIKDWLHGLGRAWRPSRAAASWRNAHRLQYYGMLTPQPLLMYERRYCGMRGRAYFVSAYSPWPDAQAFFQQCHDQALRQHVVQQLVTLCYQWFLLKVSHGDMKASNLQVTDRGDIVVIDLDSMQQHRRTQMALRAHAKDIRRLLQNWQADTSLYNALVKSFSLIYQDHTPLKLAGISI
ncbi:lipopolysaccharide kinase InaA family protein [Methylophilus sp. 14]|uniref:lipopolysaccharide kinase InaA family protein n=1 Tax=Methylophilus sp. 14 TaxID=2781019 RepID=UPI001E492CB4|nr:lipopolysaccharide kinase InaA family protein [Methylophilus sp. 14]